MIVIVFMLFFGQLQAMAGVEFKETMHPKWSKVILDDVHHHDDSHDGEYVQDAVFRFDQEQEQWLAALIRATTVEDLQQAKTLVQEYPLSKITDLGGMNLSSRTFDLAVFSCRPVARYLCYKSYHEDMMKSLRRQGDLASDVRFCIIRDFLREDAVLSYAPEDVALCDGQRLFLCWPEDRATLVAQVKSKTVEAADVSDVRTGAAALAIDMLTLLKLKREKIVKDGSQACKCVLQ